MRCLVILWIVSIYPVMIWCTPVPWSPDKFSECSPGCKNCEERLALYYCQPLLHFSCLPQGKLHYLHCLSSAYLVNKHQYWNFKISWSNERTWRYLSRCIDTCVYSTGQTTAIYICAHTHTQTYLQDAAAWTGNLCRDCWFKTENIRCYITRCYITMSHHYRCYITCNTSTITVQHKFVQHKFDNDIL